MFNANNGQANIANKVDELTDDFAAWFSDLDPRDQLSFMEKLNSVRAQVATGQAPNTSAQPAAAALAAGTATPQGGELQVVLDQLRTSGQNGKALAVMRIINDADPGGLPVDSQGNPEALTNAINERDQAWLDLDPRVRDSVAWKLAQANARLDPQVRGSVAQQLAQAQQQQDPAVKTAFEGLIAAWDSGKTVAPGGFGANKDNEGHLVAPDEAKKVETGIKKVAPLFGVDVSGR